MVRIGLTGGIGSGKSTVAQMLLKQGVKLIDADQVSRQLTGPDGLAMPALVQSFGATVAKSDGALDRDAMRALMLRQADAKKQLEAILHPMIRHSIELQMDDAQRAGCTVIAADIPLLVESGARWRSRFDAIWVVDCAESAQIARVQARSAWSVSQIEAVMANQANRKARLACADVVICNEGLSLAQLEVLVSQALALQTPPRLR
jgi:dephospho-CoA kinase